MPAWRDTRESGSTSSTCCRAWSSVCPSWHPVVLVRTASCARLASQVGTRAEVVAWDVPPLGLANLWRAPPAVGPGDLLWTPHFNVPLCGSVPLAVTLHDVLPLSAPRLAGLGRSVPVRLWFGAIRARARVVFCVSDFTRREVMARGGFGAARVLVTPLGVDRSGLATETTAPHRPRRVTPRNRRSSSSGS